MPNYIYFCSVQEYLNGVQDRPYAWGKYSFVAYDLRPGVTGTKEGRERYVHSCIKLDHTRGQLVIESEGVPRQGFLTGLAQIGMFSRNPQFAQESMAYTLVSEIKHHNTRTDQQGRRNRLQRELEAVCRDCDDYFHPPEERAREELERQQAELDAEIAKAELMGRAQARAMWEEMARLRSEG